MARLATLGGAVAGRLQASLYFARKQRGERKAGRPISTVAPAVTGTTTVGQVLSCSTGTWSNSPLGYRYAWRRNGVLIAGAAANTYTLVGGDLGANINCTVTAIGKGNSAAATSNTVGPVS